MYLPRTRVVLTRRRAITIHAYISGGPSLINSISIIRIYFLILFSFFFSSSTSPPPPPPRTTAGTYDDVTIFRLALVFGTYAFIFYFLYFVRFLDPEALSSSKTTTTTIHSTHEISRARAGASLARGQPLIYRRKNILSGSEHNERTTPSYTNAVQGVTTVCVRAVQFFISIRAMTASVCGCTHHAFYNFKIKTNWCKSKSGHKVLYERRGWRDLLMKSYWLTSSCTRDS